MTNPTISFIGAGNMAGSLMGGLIDNGYDPSLIWATNPTPGKLQHLSQHFGINTNTDNSVGANHADILVFCVKPHVLKTVAVELANIVATKKPLVISIAAGIRENLIRRWLGGEPAIVRCMPNTPALVRSGATALYANSYTSNEQKQQAESILRAASITVWINSEEQMDTVTALSGSGPAYFFLLLEALQDAGEKLGLSANDARILTQQTALGAARMAMESEKSVALLREQVTSPGGTTERALGVLEDADFHSLIFKAIEAAKDRAAELSSMLEQE